MKSVNADRYLVPVEQLATSFDPACFPFQTTKEVEPLSEGIIGQNRAVQAMEFGLQVKQKGYNLFLVGPSGTGKTTYALSTVKKIAKLNQKPKDWLYVHHFQHPDQPLLLSLPPGMGQQFKQEIETLLVDISSSIMNAYQSKEVEQQKSSLINQHETVVNQMWQELEKEAEQEGFQLKRTPTGIFAVPINETSTILGHQRIVLSEREKENLQTKTRELQHKINTLIQKTGEVERKARRELEHLEKEIIRYTIEDLFKPLKEKYKELPKVIDYLNAFEEDVVHNWKDFYIPKEEREEFKLPFFKQTEQYGEQRYQVNLFVDHRDTEGAPVVYESNPTYSNLFGKIEYKNVDNHLVTDFTRIKPGAVHLANGGYLILPAAELLSDPYSYNALKRMLKTGEIRIENIADRLIGTGLKPECMPVDIKIILIGSEQLYQTLYHLDEDFRKFFKVKVEFDTEMEKNEEHCFKYAAFVSAFCEREGLRHLTAEALAEVINYSSRLSGDQRKLSTSFHEITEILIESNFYAGQANREYVEKEDIELALAKRKGRSNLLETKIRALIEEGTLMVDTDGEKVGQINGLAVLNTGDYAFGQPHKITARTFFGQRGIVNIEREALLSGKLHSKGLLILSGYLQGEFAKDKPFPLSASITFEQSYHMIDGDSASAAELFALLSSLSGVPIKQGIAVTGSVNQLGELQPIGGVNEKIEGFYYTCKAKGLTGYQGVIIPIQNVKNLLLAKEVIEDVRKGKFHIWAISNVKEGMEILTGRIAGERDEEGRYPEGSIYALIEEHIKRVLTNMKNLTSQSAEQEVHE